MKKEKIKIILVMAVTADGKIARDTQDRVDWTGKADKAYFVDVTQSAGAMIMGSTTFEAIGRVLPGRKSIVMTRKKSRKSDHPDLIFSSETPEEIIAGLEQEGYASAALIGGATVNSLFMEKGLVDEIHLTVVPLLFGSGLSLFKTPLDARLELIEMKLLEKDCLLFKYRVNL